MYWIDVLASTITLIDNTAAIKRKGKRRFFSLSQSIVNGEGVHQMRMAGPQLFGASSLERFEKLERLDFDAALARSIFSDTEAFCTVIS